MNLREALAGFSTLPLSQASKQLLASLGYASDRTIELPSSDPAGFLHTIQEMAPAASFDKAKALFHDWKSADLLFQLTDDDLSGQTQLFKETSVAPGLLRSYLFFAVELTGTDYTRGKLTGVVRQLNRLFPMPVMVLIKHHKDGKPVLSIAVINRAQNKRDANKDVLGKVAIIQGIAFHDPHRGHEDILESLAVAKLKHPQRLPINSFDTLHAAWEEIFNVELLNQRFYRELSNWYFWALKQDKVDFPDDADPDREKRRATALIRLLTRLIFCWFLKEKDLIPEKIFNEAELSKLLTNLDDGSSTFHEAILQNLFFATLNQRMGNDRHGNPYRAFALDEGFHANKETYGIDSLFRYEGHFKNPAVAVETFAWVPFLNGGLFECLDRTDEDTNKKTYIDGFSRNPKKRPTVPNELFFGKERIEDLSESYGDPKRKKERVRGLIPILNAYKFTIVENTPIDQEIALDPELLGKVFENLLASFNTETQTTARKQTGSFYTPRPIVDYIVDETLKAHLAKALKDHGMSETDAKVGLDILFAYTEKQHLFNEKESQTLLDAIHTCKILDPACGSGAFPMGMLHKLVHIIHKLDPNNERWKQLQIDKASEIPDSSSRDAAIEAIHEAFEENEDDYGRKLYLIENCLYGVDIQPIAIQISKLRFFVSLVCDQRTNDIKENRGIKPLPNLETKFIAADTLLGLDTPVNRTLIDPDVEKVETELERLYHRHFDSRVRKEKLDLQRKSKEERMKLGKLLESSIGSDSAIIASWDPFDQQAAAPFFDPRWMFGKSLDQGFDIVFGNPPYLFLSGKGSLVQKLLSEGNTDRAHILSEYFNRIAAKLPRSSQGCRDYYKWFFQKGLELLNGYGVLGYITPNTYLTLTRYADIRQLLFSSLRGSAKVLDLGFDVFSVPIVPSAITIIVRNVALKNPLTFQYADLKEIGGTLPSADAIVAATAEEISEIRIQGSELLLYNHPLAESVYTTATMFGKDYYKAKEGEHNLDSSTLLVGSGVTEDSVPIVLDATLRRFSTCSLGFVSNRSCPRYDRELHSGRRIYLRKTGDSIVCGFPPSDDLAVAHQNVYVVKAIDPNLHWTLAAILNSSTATFLYRSGIHGQKGRVMAQFRVHALEALPFPSSVLPSQSDNFNDLVHLVQFARKTGDEMRALFLEDLLDACVMECYFRDHMAERDLLFHDQLRIPLSVMDRARGGVRGGVDAPDDAAMTTYLHQFYETVNAPSHPIRNQLIRLTAESPDLLAVIKREGAV